jgi:hypothetical protein
VYGVSRGVAYFMTKMKKKIPEREEREKRGKEGQYI